MDLCIYHANCNDGLAAAWAVWKRFPDVDLFAAQYGEDPPLDLINGADVAIVDFSYKRLVMLEIMESARSLTILDHHKTAQGELTGLTLAVAAATLDTCHIEFDMERSGAMMAWQHFHPDKQHVPWIIRYVQDRDLWRKNLADCDAIHAALASYPQSMTQWDDLANWVETSHDEIAIAGRHILRERNRLIELILSVEPRRMGIGGYDVPVVNAPLFWASDIAGRLAESEPFGAVYTDLPDGRVFSLRSRGDVDVSKIAVQYGGGGHAKAAGFKDTQNHNRFDPLPTKGA